MPMCVKRGKTQPTAEINRRTGRCKNGERCQGRVADRETARAAEAEADAA